MPCLCSVITVSAGHQFAVNRWNPAYTGGSTSASATPSMQQGILLLSAFYVTFVRLLFFNYEKINNTRQGGGCTIRGVTGSLLSVKFKKKKEKKVEHRAKISDTLYRQILHITYYILHITYYISKDSSGNKWNKISSFLYKVVVIKKPAPFSKVKGTKNQKTT